MSFEKAIEFVIAQEGGLKITDDPSDPGGLTKFGISQRAYPSLDIRGLTQDAAKAIYRQDYYDRCRCSDLPPCLAIVVFDMAVTRGRTPQSVSYSKLLASLTMDYLAPRRWTPQQRPVA